MDYWQHLDWEVVESWAEIETKLAGRPLWLLTKFAEKLVWKATFQKGDVLVFGSETRGLPESLRLQHTHNCLKLPMYEQVRSLNLASTANTVMYEAVRQLGGLP
jgi:tRNA (cytidine/uridine-2'-O-)-methyltransferase